MQRACPMSDSINRTSMDPSGGQPVEPSQLGDETEFAKLIADMVNDRAPCLFAVVIEYGDHLDVLTDTEARTLLTTALGDINHATTDAQRAITELISLCDGFPLALGLIAARIRTHPDLLDDLVTDLRDLGLDALDSDDLAASLPTVLSWSLRHLTDTQRTLFGLMGIAPGPDTTLPAVVSLTALPPARAHKALSALEEASLVKRRPHGRYAMHDLVRDYATTTAHDLPNDVRKTALTRAMDFHLHTAFAADRLLTPHRQPVQPDPPAPSVQPHRLSDAAAAMAWLEVEHATLLATQRAAVALGQHHVVWHLAWALDVFHVRRGHRRNALASWRAARPTAGGSWSQPGRLICRVRGRIRHRPRPLSRRPHLAPTPPLPRGRGGHAGQPRIHRPPHRRALAGRQPLSPGPHPASNPRRRLPVRGHPQQRRPLPRRPRATRPGPHGLEGSTEAVPGTRP
jgi:hypothetical protein